MRLYIAVLEQVPDFMVPTLVAHTVLGAHLSMCSNQVYQHWLNDSFKKCVVRVNQKEFDKICQLPGTYLGHENTTLSGQKSCAIPVPSPNEELPNVLKFAKLWKPSATKLAADQPPGRAQNTDWLLRARRRLVSHVCTPSWRRRDPGVYTVQVLRWCSVPLHGP